MTRPRTSIALASYNGAAFIGEQLQSFARQSRPPDELVVTDDGSTDATPQLVEQFAADAPFAVRFERNPQRLGYSANFARALSLCSGGIIFLSDQDDVWFDSKLETVLAAFGPGVHLLVNDQRIVDPQGREGPTVLGNMRRLGYPDRTFVTGSCTAMTADFARFLLPFPPGIAYDNWIGMMADYLGVKRIIDRPLQLFRRHGDNASDSIFASDRASKLADLRRHGVADPRSAWRNEIAALHDYGERIARRREQAEKIAGPGNVAEALTRIAREQAGYAARLQLLDRPRPLRAAAVLRHWLRGSYAQFSGWKSALKDLVRP